MGSYNLRQYREAKTIVPHLNAILKVIDLSTRGLTHFKSYIPVMKILKVLAEQKVLLEMHKNNYDKILKNKGQI